MSSQLSKIKTVAGHPVVIREADGCFQTSVAGKNYVATTMEGLHQALQHHHAIIFHQEPVIPAHIQHLVRKPYERIGDEYKLAVSIAKEVGRPPAYAHAILAEAKRLAGKNDLADLTYHEITERVQDLIMRNAIMRLWANRFEVE